jgi:ferredoxin
MMAIRPRRRAGDRAMTDSPPLPAPDAAPPGDADRRAERALRLLPHGWTAPLPAGRTLLQAAGAAGIELPSSCRNGTCRACLCRMAEGRVRYRIDWPGVSADERREGWILPCVAVPDEEAPGDIVLESPSAVRPAR